MHPTTRLGLALLALSPLALFAQSAADIAKFGVTVPTSGIVPVVVEGQGLAALDRDFDANAEQISVDLRPRFTLAGALGGDRSFVQFRTTLGTFNVEMLADGTDEGAEDLDPHITVNNFKSYLATDTTAASARSATYDGTFIHRTANLGTSAAPKRILQGGGYRVVETRLPAIQRKASIVREFRYANTRGTLAMARTSAPDSATSEWFVNLDDNTSIFNTSVGTPPANNTYAVFARVIGSGMSVVDRIYALPTPPDDWNILQILLATPLRNWDTSKPIQTTNLVYTDAVRVVPLQPATDGKGGSVLAYSVTNDNPTAATASVNAAGRLVVTKGKRGGRALITVRASEGGGAFVESVLTVTHNGPPFVVKQLPGTTTAALGTTVKLTADITAWPLNIKWQFRPTAKDTWTDIPADDPRFTGVATEYLTIKLTGDTPVAVGQALALNNYQFRFSLANTDTPLDSARLAGNPTTLRVTTTLGFQTNPTSTVTSGTAVNGKLGATLTAPLGATVVLSRPALPATYPTPNYQWQRQAPGSTTWEPLVNSAAAVAASGSNPAVPAVASPYSGVNTANLTIRLNGPETPAANSTAISTLATVALHQSQYRCVITHDRGPDPRAVPQTVASPTTTLRISAVPLEIATQPAKLVYGLLTYVPGLPENEISVARISVAAKPTATNTPAKYQWQARLANTDEWVTLVNHKPATPANGGTPASPEVPTPYKGVDTATLVIRFPAEKNLESGYGLLLDGAQYRCVITNVLKDAPAPFTATAGPVFSAAATLRVLSGTVSLVTEENFRFPGLRSPGTGVRFSASGLPKGLTMNPETGVVTGVPLDKPGVFKVVVTILEGSTASSITYYTELLPLISNSSGSYEALLSPADQPPLAKLSLTVTGNGTLTGTLTTAEEKNLLPFKGSVVRHVTTGVVSLQAPVVVSRPGEPKGRAYVLTGLAIDPASGKVAVKLHTRDGSSAPLVEIASAVSILTDDDDPETDTQIEVGNPGLRLSSYTKANPAPWGNITRYTLAFSDPVPLSPTTVAIPSGSGYATATMAPDGKLSLRGKLGDGTVFTAALSSDLTGDYRLFVRPYDLPGAYFSAFINTTGLVSYPAGPNSYSPQNAFLRHTVVYSLGNQDAEDDFDDGAQVFWHRPAPATPPSPKAKPIAYSAGFPPLGLRVRMEPWYYRYYDQLGFRIAADQNSATMDLVTSGAGMNNATPNPRGLPDRLRLTIDSKGKLILNNATQPDGSKFSGMIDNGTGKFTGELTLVDTVGNPPASVPRKVSVEGVFLVPPEPFLVELLHGLLPVAVPTPVGKITAEGLGLVPALPGGAPATSRFTLDKSPAN